MLAPRTGCTFWSTPIGLIGDEATEWVGAVVHIFFVLEPRDADVCMHCSRSGPAWDWPRLAVGDLGKLARQAQCVLSTGSLIA